MNESIFNLNNQNSDLKSKIVTGLERISEAFKVLLWEKAKLLGLSPIQIQILIFIAHHKLEFCNVSHLAKEFNITKPTVSDAVKALNDKGYIIKDFSSEDSRSYSILLSKPGEQIVADTENFANPLKGYLKEIPNENLESLFGTLSQLIYKLNRTGILTVQRTCFGCTYYSKTDQTDYCNLLDKDLLRSDIRLDCPEFEANHSA